jgi:hypothetical protein
MTANPYQQEITGVTLKCFGAAHQRYRDGQFANLFADNGAPSYTGTIFENNSRVASFSTPALSGGEIWNLNPVAYSSASAVPIVACPPCGRRRVPDNRWCDDLAQPDASWCVRYPERHSGTRAPFVAKPVSLLPIADQHAVMVRAELIAMI